MKVRDIVLAVCETIIKVAIIAIIVMFIYRGALLAYDYGYRIFEEPPMAGEGMEGREVVVTIPEGMSAKEMGQLLFMKGLIRDEQLFRIQHMLSEYKKDLKPGTFTLKTSMTVDEMLKAMTITPETEEE